MACKIDKSLVEEHLKCLICHGILKNARMLECGHSYCKTCISTVIDYKRRQQRLRGVTLQKIECPMCRQDISIQGGSGNTLKQNWIANNILHVLAESEKQDENACQDHPGNELDYYCNKCNDIVCCHCAISDHIHHWGVVLTRPQRVENVIDDIKREIKALLEKAEDWSAEHVVYEDAIVDLKQVGSQAMDLVERDVLQEYDARLELLNKSRDRLLGHIAKSKDSFCERMDKLQQTEREYIDNVEQCCMQANDKLDTGTDKDVVRFHQDWFREMKSHLSYAVPDMSDAESDLKVVRAFYFEKLSIPSDSMYEDIGFIGNHLKSEDVQTSSASYTEREDNQETSESQDIHYADTMLDCKYAEYVYRDFQFTCNRRRKINKKRK